VLVADSVSGQAVATRAECYVPDVDREARYCRYLGEEMKSELAVPLISGEQVMGVLNLESPVPAFFTAEHARILQVLAGQAAVAIERARRTEVERLAAIGGLAGDIIHRLNNPIGALSGWLDTLQRKPFYAELVAAYPYVARFADRTERDIQRAKAIIQELRTEIKRQAPAAVAVQPAVAEALERCGFEAGNDAGIRLSLVLPEQPLRVLAGPSLTGVFWNLFDNARKAMPDGGLLTITVDRADAPGWVRIVIADTGVGIEPWRLPTIFEADASTTADHYAPAHGLGLWWTRQQVEGFGGQIEIASEPGVGTRFTLRLRAAG
jgi:two-component system sensor kinase FixL